MDTEDQLRHFQCDFKEFKEEQRQPALQIRRKNQIEA
jgi:hypothetical protein